MATITGTTGDDNEIGTTGPDTFDLFQGGNDTATGLGDSDTFNMGAALNALDQLDGGGGNGSFDHVYIDGDYSGANALTLGATTLIGIEYLHLAAGHSYDLTMNDGNLALNAHMHIDALLLGAGDVFNFDASAETNGIYTLNAGQGTNHLIGGAQAQAFFYFQSGAMLGTDDTINGGGSHDAVGLSDSDYVAFTFLATTMVNVETLSLQGGQDYDLTTDDATVAAGKPLNVSASPLGVNDTFVFDGSAETDGYFTINAGAGLNILIGGAKNDGFAYTNDGISFFDTMTAADSTDGGAGNDSLHLKGDYSAGLVFSATTVINIERMQFNGGYVYDLTSHDATVAAGKTLAVDGSYLTAGGSLAFNGAAETDGKFIFSASVGNDALTGGAEDDVFLFAGKLTAADAVNGGAGSDRVELNGDYATTPLIFTATTMTQVETLKLAAGHSYNIITADATVGSGKTLIVDAAALGAGASLTFNGGQESDGRFKITSGEGDDAIRGGFNNDVLQTGKGADKITTGNGQDFVEAGKGADVITLGGSLTATDTIKGGAGSDTVQLFGPAYIVGLTFSATTMTKVENLVLGTGPIYTLTTHDATVAAGKSLTVSMEPSALGPGGGVVFDGSAETNGIFKIFGGTGNNTVIGGDGDDQVTTYDGTDRLEGGAGSDKLDAGIGADVFVYNIVADSTGATRDQIVGLDFDSDTFDIAGTVSGIDTAVTTGLLRSAHFNPDLHAALSGQLHAGKAILFTADSGNLAGRTFLVIDSNGHAGYQANDDLVIRVDGAAGTLTAADFV